MSGRFQEATEAYNSYTKQVGKKTARDMDVPEYLKQCEQQKGKVDQTEIATAAETKKEPEITSKIPEPVSKPVIQPEAVQAVKTIPEKSVSATENLPVSYEKLLSQALEYQLKADSVSAIVTKQKKDLEKLTGSEKLSLKLSENDNEKLVASFQAKADQKYKEAQLAMGSRSVTKPDSNTNTNTNPNSISNTNVQPKEPVLPLIQDTTVTTKSPAPASPSVKQAEANKAPVRSARPDVDIFSYFEVLNSPVTDPRIKVVIDPEVPAGLIYRIQIAVLKNPVLPSYFKGIIPAYGFKVTGTDKIIYYVGMFRKYSDAASALAITRSKGFKDAFIVALADNKKVSSDRAVQLEKEWGIKPFTSIESIPDKKPEIRSEVKPEVKSNKKPDVKPGIKPGIKSGIESDTKPEIKPDIKYDIYSDTTTQTLVFRVEVMRASSPLTEDAVDEIRKLASKRGLEVIRRLDGKISYLVGKFITFESAQEYADLLKRNGYQESQVVSWLGKKEIPIESAKKLFENLK
jgi:hypothetical protein